jgi:hypothetical protein
VFFYLAALKFPTRQPGMIMKAIRKFNKYWMQIVLLSMLIIAANSFAQNEPLINKKPECITAVDKSSVLIQFILQDLKSSYPHKGGGGITEIKQSQTHQYDVSIAQEERIDRIRYELSIDQDCNVKILKKEESTLSF